MMIDINFMDVLKMYIRRPVKHIYDTFTKN